MDSSKSPERERAGVPGILERLKLGWIAFASLCLLTASIMIFLFDRQLDTQAHISYIEDELTLSYPLWHWTVTALNTMLPISMKASAIMSNSLYPLATTAFMVVFLRSKLPELSVSNGLWLAVLLSLTAALFVPGFSRYMYYGAGTANVWHNPTFFPVKLFQLICIFCVGLYYSTRRATALVGALLTLALSLLGKPSFGLSFVPALMIYAVVADMRDHSWKKALILPALGFLVLTGSAVVQFLTLYGDENIRDASVIVAPFVIWNAYTNSVFVSILTALAFPIAVACVALRVRVLAQDSVYQLSWINLVVAMLTYIIFAETYSDALNYHANFAWGYYLAMGPLFATSLIQWLKHKDILASRLNQALGTLFALHVLCGLIYISKLFATGDIS